jgi:hypothetical protein
MFLNNPAEILRSIDDLKEDMMTDKDVLKVEFFAMDSDDPALLKKISRLSKHQRIRLALARNKKTPGDILHKFVTDKDVSVKVALAGNPGLESYDLVILSMDPNEEIQALAKENMQKQFKPQEGSTDEKAKEAEGAKDPEGSTAP